MGSGGLINRTGQTQTHNFCFERSQVIVCCLVFLSPGHLGLELFNLFLDFGHGDWLACENEVGVGE